MQKQPTAQLSTQEVASAAKAAGIQLGSVGEGSSISPGFGSLCGSFAAGSHSHGSAGAAAWHVTEMGCGANFGWRAPEPPQIHAESHPKQKASPSSARGTARGLI